jgi:hypothetical protein
LAYERHWRMKGISSSGQGFAGAIPRRCGACGTSTKTSTWHRPPFVVVTVLAVAALLVSAAHASAAKLMIEPAGTGSGTVASAQTGSGGSQINCHWDGSAKSGTCEENFGTAPVELTATNEAGSTFVEWTKTSTGGLPGTCSGTTTPCTTGFLLANLTLTATFNVFFPPPTVAIEPPIDIGSGGATFHGTVDPNGVDTTWHFEYRPVGASGWASVPVPDGDAGAGETAEPVEVTADDLEPNTEYEVRLVAANESSSEVSDVEAFATRGAAPVLGAPKAYSVSDTTATLAATVNPGNAQVNDCHFEYGSTVTYGQVAACEPQPGSGSAPMSVSANVAGLVPSTTYHFRVVAANECVAGCGVEVGEDASLETYPTFGFPSRGFELVSAADTNGIDAQPVISALDGEAYSYLTYIPAPGAPNGKTSAAVRTTRGSDGSWSQVGVGAPPTGSERPSEGTPVFSTDDLSLAAIPQIQPNDPDDQNGVGDTYLEDLASQTPTLTWLSRNPTLPEGAPQTELGSASSVQYVSPDGNRVLFESTRHLLSVDQATSGRQSLYEWTRGASPHLKLVGILPGETSGSVTGSQLGSSFESGGTTYGAVSADGSRIVFRAEDAGRTWHLYVRLDGDHTVEASKSVGVTPEVTTPRNVNFWGADAGANLIVFTSASALTPDSQASNTNNGPTDLYVYNVDEDSLHDLTPETGGAGIRTVYAVSADGRRIYFTAGKRLTSGQGTPGGPNLYLAELNGRGELVRPLVFIAPIDSTEEVNVPGVESGGMIRQQRYREAATNPSGTVLAFRDTLDVVPGRWTGGLHQVFVYDSLRHELSCASCPSDGVPAVAAANLTPSRVNNIGVLAPAGAYPSSSPAMPHTRNVSTDGTVYFQTATPLISGDVNDAIDVYEDHANQLALVSPGRGENDAIFGDASSDGSSVFFASAESLLMGAERGVGHIYVARAGATTPSPPSEAPPCSGQDCRGPAAQAPVGRPAASNLFVEAGNGHSLRKCSSLGQRAKALGRHAARLSHQARRVGRHGGPKAAKQIRRRAHRFAKRARHASREAKQCRRGSAK